MTIISDQVRNRAIRRRRGEKTAVEVMADENLGNAAPSNAVKSENLDVDAFAASMFPEESEQTDTQPEETDLESTDADDEDETEEVEPSDSEEDEEQESEGGELPDLDDLSPEQLQALAKKTRSKAIARYGELTGRIRALEAKIETQQQAPADPLKAPAKVKIERIAKIEDVEGLRQEKEQAEVMEEWAQQILDQHGSADAQDVVTTYEGKEYTKEQVLNARNYAQRLQKKEIPARLEELQRAAEIDRLAEHNAAQAAEMIPEIADESSAVGATYKSLITNPAIKKAMGLVPELKMDAAMIMALAARSLEQIKADEAKGKKPAKPATGQPLPRPKVPAAPSSAGGSSGQPDAGKSKKVQSLRGTFEKKGDLDSFAALLSEGGL